MKAGFSALFGRWAMRWLGKAPGPWGPSPAWALAGLAAPYAVEKETSFLSIAGSGNAGDEPGRGGLPGRPEPVQAAESDAGGAGQALPRIGDLYRKYSPSLYWVCMKYTRNKEDAEDMVNQVFVKVQQNLSGFKGQSGIYTWMYRIAANECIQMLRRRKFEVDGAFLDGFDDLIQMHPGPAMDAKLVLQKIMAGTDAETQELIFLLYMEGLTQEEVVDKIGISRSTLHRKVSAFKARMEKFR